VTSYEQTPVQSLCEWLTRFPPWYWLIRMQHVACQQQQYCHALKMKGTDVGESISILISSLGRNRKLPPLIVPFEERVVSWSIGGNNIVFRKRLFKARIFGCSFWPLLSAVTGYDVTLCCVRTREECKGKHHISIQRCA